MWSQNLLVCGSEGFCVRVATNMNNSEKRPLTLRDRIYQIDPIQLRKFDKLKGVAQQIAAEGIIRHLKACDRMDVRPEPLSLREIMEDATVGRRIFAETNNDVLLA